MAKTKKEESWMSWLKAIDDARDVEGVLAVVDDFIESRSEVYWLGVPEGMRHPLLRTDEDLQRWHHELIREIKDMASPGTPMQELCIFSLRASVRVHQIRLREEPGGSSNDREFKAAGNGRSRR
jgi:hypothetical protein